MSSTNPPRVRPAEDAASASPDRRAGSAWHWRVVVGAFAIMLANSIPLSVLSIFTPFVTDSLGFATGEFQLYYTLMGVSAMFTMPLAGRLTGRMGARVLLVIGGLVAASGLFIMSVGGVLWHFYVGGVVLGLGAGLGCMFIPVVLVNNWFHAKRGLVMGLVMAGTGVGGAIMSQLLPPIIGTTEAGWRAGYLLVVAVMILFTIGPAWLLVRTRPADIGLLRYGESADPVTSTSSNEPRRLPGLSYRQALRSPWFYLFYAMIVLLGIIVAIMQSVSVHLRIIGLTQAIGFYMTVLTLGLVFWKIALGALVDALGMRWAMIITFALFVAACLLAPGTTNRILLVAIMIGIAAGVANSTVMPPLAGAITVGQRDFTAIWGIGGTAISLGTAVGTPIWGAVKDATGDFQLAFYLLPGLVVLYLLGLVLAMQRGRASYTERDSAEDSVPA